LLLVVLSALLALTVGCARQTRGAASAPAEVDEAMIAAAMRGAVMFTEFKGFGEITMVQAGQRMTGKFDARRNNHNGSFSAQVYSPFGSVVASIIAEDFAGRVTVGRERFDFTFENSMEGVPFPAARYFRYGDFAQVLTASMPPMFWELPASPDTLIRSRRNTRTVTAAWISEDLTVRVQIAPRTGQMASAAFIFTVDGVRMTIQFSRFRRGVPYEILIREGSRNYITVLYETMTWK
jgi:hypothetical protein